MKLRKPDVFERWLMTIFYVSFVLVLALTLHLVGVL